eukprot:COSAG06_NODE_4439_length_4265_cov_3.761402_3_plen_174_part_01
MAVMRGWLVLWTVSSLRALTCWLSRLSATASARRTWIPGADGRIGAARLAADRGSTVARAAAVAPATALALRLCARILRRLPTRFTASRSRIPCTPGRAAAAGVPPTRRRALRRTAALIGSLSSLRLRLVLLPAASAHRPGIPGADGRIGAARLAADRGSTVARAAAVAPATAI